MYPCLPTGLGICSCAMSSCGTCPYWLALGCTCQPWLPQLLRTSGTGLPAPAIHQIPCTMAVLLTAVFPPEHQLPTILSAVRLHSLDLQVKAWCYYESRLLGAHHGLISTYALETMVLYIFNVFHKELKTACQESYFAVSNTCCGNTAVCASVCCGQGQLWLQPHPVKVLL